jgi:signal transduction histidine kinase/CheY-like chemotaxis protein
LNPRTGKMRVAEGLKSDQVRHVMVNRDGRVWVSTRHGLFRSEPNSIRFEQVFPAGTEPAEDFQMSMTDRLGETWVAGDHGLARWADGRWTRFTTKDGLKSDQVTHLAEDPDGSLWIGYYDAWGVTKLYFDGGQLKLQHFTTTNGLRSDKSIFLGFDSRGWLWAGTDHGADVFDRNRWHHYGRQDGLIWDDCNSNAFMADSNGRVWIGTSRGLSRFTPSDSPATSIPPPVVFTNVKLGSVTVDPLDSIEVPYSRNALRVQFAALTFKQESGVLFRYRLANEDGPWLETAQRELNYPKLPPGHYTLEVQASNGRGVWSSPPAQFSFQILNPWWLTWWFRFASVMATLVIGRLLWQRRTYRLEAERQRLEIAVTQRTRELSLEKQRVFEEKGRAEQRKVEIERLLEEAQLASRYKSEFLANVSHEIRTPMNGILGMTDLVLATELNQEQRECLSAARLSASSLLTILNDVLDLSKIEAGRLDLSPILFSLRQFLEETGTMFGMMATERKLGFEIQVAEDVPDTLVGDPDRLRQILFNLITNALKFTAKGGIRLSVDRQEDHGTGPTLHFAIRDTGIGIPPEKQQLIFEAFRQADGSTTRKYGGTGLGLTICSRLVEMMGGAIRVESEPGKGSTFHFTARFELAVVDSTGATSVASLQNMLQAVGTREHAPSTSLNILLAEDNIVNQRVAMRLLEKRGHRVTVAATGRETLDLAERERFDVILMDIQMPDMDGLEATAAIREREKQSGDHVPIVALTAHTMKGDRERCLEAGMNAYVNKPFEPAQFLEIVEAAAAVKPFEKPAL